MLGVDRGVSLCAYQFLFAVVGHVDSPSSLLYTKLRVEEVGSDYAAELRPASPAPSPVFGFILPSSFNVSSTTMSRLDLRGVWLALLLASPAFAHGGHKVPEGVVITDDPIVRRLTPSASRSFQIRLTVSKQQDATLWAHITLMGIAFGIIYPFGMVLGVRDLQWFPRSAKSA